MRRYSFLLIALLLHIAARGQITTDAEIPVFSVHIEAQSMQYWFDTDIDNMQTVSGLTGTYTLDVSSIADGLHTLHYQVIGTDGNCYGFASEVFLKMINSIFEPTTNSSIAASKLEYWFDIDTDNMQTISELSGIYMLDVSELEDGLHTLHIQVVGVDGTCYDKASEVFLKMPNSINEPVIAEAPVAKNLRYWFNNDFNSAVLTDLVNGIQTLDVSDLSGGLHVLYYQIIYDDGNVGPTESGIFFKDDEMPEMGGPNGITRYQYWLNDDGLFQTVTLDAATNPYQLISLLPIKKVPIRSSAFHFEVKENVPIIYGKNDFHIRFHDAKGYFVDDGKQFIDYSSKQEVKPVQSLEGYTGNVSLNKPVPNDILWYTMQASPGDTVAFKLSQPATLQLFAPSGEEVFNTSEYASVNWDGIHTWEDGTYYVAVHDVTGSRSNMTLDYMHMDKYDVVDWDVHTVGNGGCSTITFKGNGFKDLYAVDLYIANGDSIYSVDISHDSDAETAVTFDFSGEKLGVYNAVFHFTQEDRHFANVVTVEDAVDIELATDVSFPSTFLRGTSTTYTIKITNKGNMTAYAVPVYTWIKNSSKNSVSLIHYDGMNFSELLNNIYVDGLDSNDTEEIKNRILSLGDDVYFLKTWTKDDTTNDSIMVRTNYSFITIAPNSTKALNLVVKSNDLVDVWITTPNEWLPISDQDTSNSKYSRLKRNIVEDYYCCYKEHLECFMEGVTKFLDGSSFALTSASLLTIEQPEISLALESGALIAGLGGCASSLTNDQMKNFGSQLCNSKKDKGLDRFLDAMKSKTPISLGSIVGCVGSVLSAWGFGAKAIFKAEESLIGNFGSVLGGGAFATDLSGSNSSCKKSREKKPNCPPNPGGGGGSSTPQPPADPNDIYGYLSDAGSKFMTDEVTKVNYTVEFENDTAFAQASAHTIVIRDTLDSRYFDLKSFLPTSVKIGEREVFLDEMADVKTAGGVTSFLKTIDMRPEINAIAQVEGEYSQQTGIAKWTFTSLDPMTMEPTDDLMQGILPVNYDGTSGIGEVMFEVGMKPNKGNGKEIKNRASIVFDYEEAILTPTWVNTVDAIAPVSRVSDVQQLNDSVAVVSIDASDELSGVWRYDVYVQYGEGSGWWKAAENVPADTVAYVKIYEGIDYGFYVIATDSAGNVEAKIPAKEWPRSDNDDIPTVISKSSTVNDPFYDLQGKRVKQPKKGIFIRRGKKEVKR